MPKSKIFFWILVSVIAGIAVSSYLPVTFRLGGAVFIFGASIAAFGIAGGKKRAIVAGCMAMALALGMVRFLHESRPARVLDGMVGERVTTEGVLDEEPVHRARSQRLVVREPMSRARILVTVRPFPEFSYGERVRLSGKLAHPENFSEDFDYAAYLAKDGIYYTMAFPEIERLYCCEGSRIYRVLFKIKSAFAANLSRALPEPHASFMAGLILGERASFPAELTEKLQQTGTSHIVALSGYNITIVADALMRTLTFFLVPHAAAFWLAVLGIILFTMLTGASASVVRAAVMGVLVLIARRSGRVYRMRNALAFSAAAMLLIDPKALRFDVGFQFSFLATLGLLYGAPMVEQWLRTAKRRMIPPFRDAGLIRQRRDAPPPRRKRRILRETAIATLSAQLFVLPDLVFRFGRLSLVSPFANLAVLPFIPTTMFFGFFSGGAGFLSEALGRVTALPGYLLLGYELLAVDFFSRLPLASLEIPGFGPALMIGAYLGIGYLFWKHRRHDAEH